MNKKYLLLSALIMAAMFVATVLAWPHLPDRIPMHWNAHGEVDRYGPRASIFIQDGVMLALLLLWTVLPWLSPQRFKVDQFKDTYWLALLFVVALLAYVQAVQLWSVLGRGVDTGRAVIGGLGLFYALLGNVIGKVRRNFWLGVRTPWTLANERVWYSTHRFAAKSMVAGGLLTVAASIAGLPTLGMAVLIAGFLLPAVWSLVYYKRLEKNGRLEA